MLATSAILAATETAITATSPGKIQKLKSKGDKRASSVLKVLKTKEEVIGTLLIGNSLINTVCTTIATSLFISLLGDAGTIVASAVMAFLIIVFCEVVPKAIAVAKAEQLALMTSPTIIILLTLLKPINKILELMVKILCKILRINLTQQFSATEEVRGVIEHYHQEGNVYKADRDMLGGILDIRNMTISEVMTHRSNLFSINVDLPNVEIVKLAFSTPHTRIPMWQDHEDNIVGILHIKNLPKNFYTKDNNNIENTDIKSLLSTPWFIPDNVLVIHQLQAFRERHNHLACVVDEYGGLKGIVTLEDILEVIVGPIIDEHDNKISLIFKNSDAEFVIDGIANVRDINRELNWNLPDEDATTIAGLIIHKLQRIPEQGDILDIFDLRITITEKIVNKINKLKVIVPHNTR